MYPTDAWLFGLFLEGTWKVFESWCDRARITDARGKDVAKVLHTAL
jgi:hypothetical protein